MDAAVAKGSDQYDNHYYGLIIKHVGVYYGSFHGELRSFTSARVLILYVFV